MKQTNELKHLLNKILDAEVNEVISGGSNGSMVVLKISLSELQQFSLSIYCSWRLETKSKILTGSNESSNGNLLKETQLLLFDKIMFIKRNSFNDLKITFKSKKVFNIFCDITPKCDEEYFPENWTICDISQNICYTANKNKEIQISTYD